MRRWLPGFCLTLVVVAFHFDLLHSTERLEREIVTFSGKGDFTTEDFSVPFAWGLHWETDGVIFQVTVRSRDTQVPTSGFSQEGGTKGFLYQLRGGAFFLQVTATGNWTIHVVEITP